MSAVHISKSNTKCGDFLWVCIIDDGSFSYSFGWLRINYNENREHQRACHWLPLQINMQNNAWQRFPWLGYALSENLTIELNHKRLLITFYLTHTHTKNKRKKMLSALPRPGPSHSDLWCGLCLSQPWEVPCPLLTLRRELTLSPAACNVVANCVVTSHITGLLMVVEPSARAPAPITERAGQCTSVPSTPCERETAHRR